MHCSKPHSYSITSSASASSVGGTARGSAFAALRLITSSNLVGCKTGRSAGLAPLRIRPAYNPDRLIHLASPSLNRRQTATISPLMLARQPLLVIERAAELSARGYEALARSAVRCLK